MKKSVLLILLLSTFIISQCDNDVDNHDEDHLEPVGLIIKNAALQPLLDYTAPITPTDTLEVPHEGETDLLTVVFKAEDGDEFTPDGSEYSLGFDVPTNAPYEIEQHEGDGKWSFHIKGLILGTSTLVLELKHGDHADFKTVGIPVKVEEHDGEDHDHDHDHDD